MKYIAKQKKRQAVSKRVMRREQNQIRLIHEIAVLKNFGLDDRNVQMYKMMMEDGFSTEAFDTEQKKTYSLCQKFAMLNDYQNLKELELERDKVRDELNMTFDDQEYEMLRKKLKNMNKECQEFRQKLNETDEGRRNFRLCLALDGLEY
jgi:hypothetical protein